MYYFNPEVLNISCSTLIKGVAVGVEIAGDQLQWVVLVNVSSLNIEE